MAQVAFPDQDNKWLLSHLTRGLQCYPSAQELSTVLFLDFCLPCFFLSLVSKAAFSKALFHVLEDTAHVVKYSKTGEMCMQLCRYSLYQFSSAICSFQTGRAQSQFSTQNIFPSQPHFTAASKLPFCLWSCSKPGVRCASVTSFGIPVLLSG